MLLASFLTRIYVREIHDISQLVREVGSILGKPREGEGKKVAALRLLLVEAGRHALTAEVRMGSLSVILYGCFLPFVCLLLRELFNS